ncbi:hypothetical protein GOBAR_DD34127 [Gossypium barbadense]|nr:hypothetical protein GOBAR_DD34127 [Gossypium barbadense]
MLFHLNAGGALLSTLSIHLGFEMKQALDNNQQYEASTRSKGIGSSNRRPSGCHLHSNMYSFTQEDDECFNCISSVRLLMYK